MKRFAAVAVLLCLSLGFVTAEEQQLSVYVTSFDGKNITFRTIKGAEDKSLQVSADVRVGTGKLNKDTKKVEIDTLLDDGLRNSAFATGKTSARITINNNRDRVIQVVLFKSTKKKA